jgi:hypothetical protein
MQSSFRPVSPSLLWHQRVESPSGSTAQSKQHNSYSNHQRRCHHRVEDGRWNGAYPMKVGVGWSTMFPMRLRGSSVVQGSPCGPKELWSSPQDNGWGSLLEILHPPETTKMYQDLNKNFWWTRMKRKITRYVLEWHVEGSSRSFEACWKSTTIEHSWVEVRKYLHGLHRGFVSHLTCVQLDMGHCGPPDQVGSLYTCIHYIQGPTICWALPITHCPLSWYLEDYYLWQRVYLCGMILGTTTWLFGHPFHPQFILSSPDGWINWASQSNHQRYAPCLCSERWSKMGPASPTRWVLIQQQLSRKHEDVTFWSTLWTTLSHIAKLVRDRWMSYIWSRHRDRGRRESKINSCQHPDCPIPSEKLHRQKASSLRVWSGGSHIPLSLPNERCTSLRHQKQAGFRYIGLYPIIDKYGSTSYQVELLSKLSGVHNVFHVAQLKRCLKPLTDVVV